MFGFEALSLGNAWNVGVACLGAMTGQTEDLEIIGFVCPTKGYEPES